MTELQDAQKRSALIAARIKERTDVKLRDLIASLEEDPLYCPLEDLMISKRAWIYTQQLNVSPQSVFAHPDVLRKHPRLSQYYRGIALLPFKRVKNIAGSVESWEDPTKTPLITEEKSKCVARLYNAVICSIIEGTSKWTLENGYRNITATMGITLDGVFRNIIGRDAEQLIKNRIIAWLDNQNLTVQRDDKERKFQLPNGYWMHYGSEPDIFFKQDGATQDVATIEIKGGKDPAGALERLGAMKKSFDATPTNCVNMLIAGIVTPEMQSRLDDMGMTDVFLIDDLAYDGDSWNEFVDTVFRRTICIGV